MLYRCLFDCNYPKKCLFNCSKNNIDMLKPVICPTIWNGRFTFLWAEQCRISSDKYMTFGPVELVMPFGKFSGTRKEFQRNSYSASRKIAGTCGIYTISGVFLFHK